MIVAEPDPSVGLEPIRGPSGQLTSRLTVWPTFPLTDPRTIAEISVGHPAIYTISGIHVGSTYDEVLRTYPYAVEKIDGQTGGPNSQYYVSLRITNAEGRTIIFSFNLDRIVRLMTLGLTPTTTEDHAKC